MMNKLALSCVLLALSACSAGGEGNARSAAASATVTAGAVAAFTEPMPADVWQQFDWHTRRVRAALAQASATEADQLYIDLLEIHRRLLPELDEQDYDFRTSYLDYWEVDAEGKSKPTPKLLARQQELAALGLRYFNLGEGMIHIRPQADYYVQLFGRHPSPSVQTHQRLEHELAQSPLFDADDDSQHDRPAEVEALLLPWDELRAGPLPSGLQLRTACRLSWLQQIYIVEAHPDISEDKAVPAALKQTWQRFVDAHPQSSTAKVLHSLLTAPVVSWTAMEAAQRQQQLPTMEECGVLEEVPADMDGNPAG